MLHVFTFRIQSFIFGVNYPFNPTCMEPEYYTHSNVCAEIYRGFPSDPDLMDH